MALAASALPCVAHAADGDIDGLLRAMTLEEKVALLHGATDPLGQAGAGYVPGVPRLGVPPLRLADGPAGARTAGPATAMPAPIALAAGFSGSLAREYGRVIARDARANHQDVVLAPTVNIIRVLQSGRNFETIGEDPFLAARLAAEEVHGIRQEGMIATVKHFAANSFQTGQATVSADIDEQTLREIYLPAFEAAVGAGAGAVMAAANRINGKHCSENSRLLTETLRGAWAFEGWVMSDWGATHSGVPALAAGLDMEMPSGEFFRSLGRPAIAGGLPPSLIDRSVRRILAEMDRAGMLDAGRLRPAVDDGMGARAAREVALAGAVLLRNERHVLPLREEDLRSLALVGPTASIPLIGGGGSARVVPQLAESLRDALARRRGGEPLAYAEGIDLDGIAIPSSALSTPGSSNQRGLLRRDRRSGKSRVDAAIDRTGGAALPAGASWTRTGTLTAPTSGDYALKLQVDPLGDDVASPWLVGGSAVLRLDGKAVATAGGPFGGDASLLRTAGGLASAGARVRLQAGVAYHIRVDANAGPATPLQVRLAWVTPQRRQEKLDEAVALARRAGTVVLFAHDEATEGRDRKSLALPADLDPLIRAVTRANPRTVVVLSTGHPVLMPWVDEAAAILQMWYPGQEGGDATAALLLGETSPSGKLPVTFPRRAKDVPTNDRARYPGIGNPPRAAYAEGIFVGYRWYDLHELEPLFPFGHGLSYARFVYSALEIRPAGDGLDIAFVVRNAGTVRASEVAQVYLGPPHRPQAPMAAKQLAGFVRLDLAPSEARRVVLRIGARELSFWSVARGDWVVATGTRPVFVGSSSRDIRLQGVAEVQR
jgi:beta-glucosidase